MSRTSRRLEQLVVLPTHDLGVRFPANTKYLSDNLLVRLLIKGFMKAISELSSLVDACTILDVGCGEGLTLRQLGATPHEKMLHGMDLDPALLCAARKVAPDVEYFVGDVFELPLMSRVYDLVVCTEVLEHLHQPQAALAEIARVARGWCLLSVPREPWWRLANIMRGSYIADWGNTPGHVNHWSKGGFTEFVSDYIEIVATRQPFPWTVLLGWARSGHR